MFLMCNKVKINMFQDIQQVSQMRTAQTRVLIQI